MAHGVTVGGKAPDDEAQNPRQRREDKPESARLRQGWGIRHRVAIQLSAPTPTGRQLGKKVGRSIGPIRQSIFVFRMIVPH
jgi:hypothetical protein